MPNIFKSAKTVGLTLTLLLTIFSFSRLHYTPLLFIFVLIGSLLLIQYTLGNSKKKLTLFILVYFGLVIVLKINYFDKAVFDISGFEQYQLQKRESYYKRETLRIYQNKISNIYLNSKKVYVDKVVKKMASFLQPSLYFFSKPGSAYPLFILPFFAMGILLLLARYKNLTLTYIFVNLFFAIFIETSKALLLFLPLINLAIFLSVVRIFEYLKIKLK